MLLYLPGKEGLIRGSSLQNDEKQKSGEKFGADLIHTALLFERYGSTLTSLTRPLGEHQVEKQYVKKDF